jgi:hypothetical protein
MIKIIKTEHRDPDIKIQTESKADIDFYSLTDFTLTKESFFKLFKPQMSDFGRVMVVSDMGTHIKIEYDRFNIGKLEVYPMPPEPPKKQDKRPTKNLESLVKSLNERGYHVHLDQYTGCTWECWIWANDTSHHFHVDITDGYYHTPYQAVRAAMRKMG